MRVLVASGTWYPERNGVARVATETAQKLAARGHEVTALVPRAPGLPASESEGSLTVHRVIRRGRLPLTITDVVGASKHAHGLGPFDALLAHGASMGVGLARARLAAPLALVYHASLPRELRFMRPRLPWGRTRLVAYANEPIASWLERAAVRRCARILVLSEFSRSLLRNDHLEHEAKIARVYGGVETERFSPADGMLAARARLGIAPGGRLLVTVRRAEPRMGLEELLRALRMPGLDDVALAVVGGGLLTDALRRTAAELGLDGRVRFVGRVPEVELPDWYRAADLFVLPTIAYEGFGMVTVEALASGTPVVGTPVGATPELLEPLDPRLVARSPAPDALAVAIRDCLAFADDGFRTRCREYALSRFSWDEVIVGWEKALTETMLGRERVGSPVNLPG